VQLQTSPYWEWILIDDGSTNPEIIDFLTGDFYQDPRIRVLFAKNNKNQGISKTTNRGIKAATGDYLVFLDHDDRLALNAIALIHREIEQQTFDILYSDRDMINLKDQRDFHLMKPAWSPETLLSGNYIFHLMCYRTDFIKQIGLLKTEYDGSQDYDLILRASEQNPKVKHIAQVLYHWRQHEQSISKQENAKDYTFKAGLAALNAALTRRHIKAIAQDHPKMPRGNYQVIPHFLTDPKIQIIKIEAQNYRQQIEAVIDNKADYILILAKNIQPQAMETIQQMVAWMQFKDIALISAKLINQQQILAYAGICYTKEGGLLHSYQNHHQDQQGYMGVTSITRNVSIANPFNVLIRGKVWRQLKGFNTRYNDSLSLLDFNFRALEAGWRVLYQPDCVFQYQPDVNQSDFYQITPAFKQQWQSFFAQGDPYYNPNLCQDCNEMGLPESINN